MSYHNLNFERRHIRGFSLVELMVGMTIGLFVVLIIMQSFTVFEAQKRTTTGSSDAQSSGTMALTHLEQESRNSGAGFSGSAAYNCNNTYSYFDDGAGNTTVNTAVTGVFAPVTIISGGATGSDSLTIRQGTNFLGSIPTTITSTMPNTSSELNVSSTKGFVVPSKIVISQGGNCTVMEITTVQDAALKLQHNPGGSGATWNPPASFYNTAPGNTWPGASAGPANYSTGAEIINIGEMFVKTYSVNNTQSLQVLDSSTNIAAPVTYTLVKDIVKLKAEYGVSTGVGVQPVSTWEPATGGWATLDATEVKRIKAIRVTLVARSSKKEIEDVTNAAPGGIDVTSVGADWKKYRYRVYTTIIPIRNTIWSNV